MTRPTLATSINVHGFIAETTEQAADDFYGPQAEVMNRIGRERGWGPTAGAFRPVARPAAARCSSAIPRQVAEKIVAQHKIFGNDRFLLQMAIGTDAARQDHEGDRTLRHQSGADRAQGNGEGSAPRR